jgi:cytochrome b6-f complex iron-sulfur subunit
MGTGGLIATCCLGGCSKSDSGTAPSPTPGPGGGGSAKVDFTFDVTSDTNLNSTGSTIRSGVIIAKIGTAYVAYQGSCPHQGFPLSFTGSNNTFPCTGQGPTHGSVFDSNGKRITGPAQSDLKKYNTSLSGNNLRVFES